MCTHYDTFWKTSVSMHKIFSRAYRRVFHLFSSTNSSFALELLFLYYSKRNVEQHLVYLFFSIKVSYMILHLQHMVLTAVYTTFGLPERPCNFVAALLILLKTFLRPLAINICSVFVFLTKQLEKEFNENKYQKNMASAKSIFST